MTSFVQHGEKDQEPYESGVEEGDMEEVYLDDAIIVVIHACDECGNIISACLDGDFKDIKVNEEIDKLIKDIEKSQVEKNQPGDREWVKKQFGIEILKQLKKRLGLKWQKK